jgi:uncharacterized membrane protein YuzA (DUF378 family)
MENYIFVLCTLLGFAASILIDINQRNKASKASPVRMDWWFFIKDNIPRLLLSITIMFIVFLNVNAISQLFGKDWETLDNLIYVVIGFAPDLIISFAKRKAGFLQPKEVNGYERK